MIQRCVILACLLFSGGVFAASTFIPLHDKELMLRVDSLVVLSGASGMRKPYSVSKISALLPTIKSVRPQLHREIKTLLAPYTSTAGVHFAQITASKGALSGDSAARITVPNARGELFSSSANVYAAGHVTVNGWLSVSAGIQGVDDTFDVGNRSSNVSWRPTGSVVSLGSDAFQLDLGYKERWLSPMRHSSMLISTNAPTSLSVGVSNPQGYKGLWGLEYDVFVTRLDDHSNIAFNNSLQPGKPFLLGTQLSINPISGVHISATRSMQFGGGDRQVDIGDVWNAFIDPVSNDNTARVEGCASASINDCELGNQLAALSTTLQFGGRVPFSVYFEYAGEDTAGHSITRLGNIAASGGVYVPFIDGAFGFDHIAINYEVSQWQDAWYVHSVYRDGYTNEGTIIGHWGAQQRAFNDGVGAVNHVLSFDMHIAAFKRLDVTFNYLENEDYSGVDYQAAYKVGINYTHNRHWALALTKGEGTLNEQFWRGAVTWTW